MIVVGRERTTVAEIARAAELGEAIPGAGVPSWQRLAPTP
jgi:hypothetical protein